MTVSPNAPPRDKAAAAQDLVQRARELIPILKDRAIETEDGRCIPDATLADLKAAQLHNYFTPARYGGLELDWPVHVDIGREIAKGCGSTAWFATVVLGNTWILGRFPEKAQDEAWGEKPDIVIASAFAGGNQLEPSAGGFRLNGLWRFSSGIDHADWVILGATLGEHRPHEDSDPPEFRLALVKRSQFEIVDNWYAAGLKGTGSKDIKVVDQFVPEHRTIANASSTSEDPPGAHLHDSYIYGVEFLPYFRSLLLGPLLGAAHGAMQDYLSVTKSRIGRMFGESIVDQAPVQIRIAESALELRCAEMLCRNLTGILADHGVARRHLSGVKRLNHVRDMAYIALLCRRSVDRLASMMGASGQTDNSPVQRHFRDVSAMAAHGSLQSDKALLLYGKWALGLATGDAAVDEAENEAPEPY